MGPSVMESLAPAALVVPNLVDEPFDTWDPSLWLTGNHQLGRGWVRSSNVSVQNGELSLTLPANTLDGGEVLSSRRVRYGTYEARLRSSSVMGSITAFFLYEGVRAGNDEVDIELIGGTRRVMFTTWVRGRQTNHQELTLPFDPWAAAHAYRIEYGRNVVRFFVDGVQLAQFSSSLPSAQLHVMANAWWPTWIAGGPYAAPDAAVIEWIRY